MMLRNEAAGTKLQQGPGQQGLRQTGKAQTPPANAAVLAQCMTLHQGF